MGMEEGEAWSVTPGVQQERRTATPVTGMPGGYWSGGDRQRSSICRNGGQAQIVGQAWLFEHIGAHSLFEVVSVLDGGW